jgi:hypothetical protein
MRRNPRCLAEIESVQRATGKKDRRVQAHSSLVISLRAD